MLLHRYFGSHALETLKHAELKTSRISDFNDCFDSSYVNTHKITHEGVGKSVDLLLPVVFYDMIQANQGLLNPLPDEELKRRVNESLPGAIQQIVKDGPGIVQRTTYSPEQVRQAQDRLGLRAICFSDPSKVRRAVEILLWSHYAAKHKGIRIGFEFSDEKESCFEIRRMKYPPKRAEVVWTLGPDDEAFRQLLESATVKGKVWQYEREVRLFTKTYLCEERAVRKCTSTTIEHFLRFTRDRVKSVDFGVFCPDEEIQSIVELLKIDYPKVIRRKAQIHETEYAFEYKEVR
jgi:Protein of unknown function (DUF2971)